MQKTFDCFGQERHKTLTVNSRTDSVRVLSTPCPPPKKKRINTFFLKTAFFQSLYAVMWSWEKYKVMIDKDSS